jgi:hypothetical protein
MTVLNKMSQRLSTFYKLFTAEIYEFLLQARGFVPGKPFQPSLMSVGKARTYQSEAPFWSSTLR